MKLWHGIVLGVIFFFLGYQIAGALGIPLDARSLAFSGLLTLLVAAVLLMRLPVGQRHALFRVRRQLLPWTLALLAGKLLFCQLSMVLSVIFNYDGGSSTATDGVLPVQFLSVAVLGPISEELIYRGGLTQGLCRNLPWEGGIVIPALIFSVGHKSNYGQNRPVPEPAAVIAARQSAAGSRFSLSMPSTPYTAPPAINRKEFADDHRFQPQRADCLRHAGAKPESLRRP